YLPSFTLGFSLFVVGDMISIKNHISRTSVLAVLFYQDLRTAPRRKIYIIMPPRLCQGKNTAFYGA
ncbi:MAG: hypothetical protein WAO57_13320, partial [Syntrophomonadaceae bacterium]